MKKILSEIELKRHIYKKVLLEIDNNSNEFAQIIKQIKRCLENKSYVFSPYGMCSYETINHKGVFIKFPYINEGLLYIISTDIEDNIYIEDGENHHKIAEIPIKYVINTVKKSNIETIYSSLFTLMIENKIFDVDYDINKIMNDDNLEKIEETYQTVTNIKHHFETIKNNNDYKYIKYKEAKECFKKYYNEIKEKLESKPLGDYYWETMCKFYDDDFYKKVCKACLILKMRIIQLKAELGEEK